MCIKTKSTPPTSRKLSGVVVPWTSKTMHLTPSSGLDRSDAGRFTPCAAIDRVFRCTARRAHCGTDTAANLYTVRNAETRNETRYECWPETKKTTTRRPGRPRPSRFELSAGARPRRVASKRNGSAARNYRTDRRATAYETTTISSPATSELITTLQAPAGRTVQLPLLAV